MSSSGWEGGEIEGLRAENFAGNEFHASFRCAGTKGVDKKKDAQGENRLSPIEDR